MATELALRHAGKKLGGKGNYTTWANVTESGLIEQSLWRYCGSDTPRILTPRGKDETKDAFEDRKNPYNSRVHQARAYLMLNCEQHIVEKCILFKTAKDVWDHLALYKPSGLSYEFSVYLEFENLRFDGKDLKVFVDNYSGKLEQLKPTSLKISDAQALFRFVILIEPYSPVFTANARQMLRGRTDPITSTLFGRIATALLDENNAQSNAAHSERRQLYADHIQSLSFDGDSENSPHPQYTSLSFPQLRHLNTDVYRIFTS